MENKRMKLESDNYSAKRKQSRDQLRNRMMNGFKKDGLGGGMISKTFKINSNNTDMKMKSQKKKDEELMKQNIKQKIR